MNNDKIMPMEAAPAEPEATPGAIAPPKSFRLGPWTISWRLSPSGLWGSSSEDGVVKILTQAALVQYEDGPYVRSVLRIIVHRLAIWIA